MFAQALPILYRRGIRYMTLQGGEPLVHPEIVALVSAIAGGGIRYAVITNGWFLARDVERMAAAGLDRLIVSLDSADLAEHERNRGLPGLRARMAEGIARAHACGLRVSASVMVSRLVGYDELPATLRRLGFDAVGFSYPRREPFGSTSLVWREITPGRSRAGRAARGARRDPPAQKALPGVQPDGVAHRGRALCPRRAAIDPLHRRP
jgi:MoaA/NifB/PqqE/SkfB family radical SAM enzyme